MDKEQSEDDINEDVSDGRRLLPHASKMIMNERVQNLATAVYQEFEKMISNYDANVVKNLMPIVVEYFRINTAFNMDATRISTRTSFIQHIHK